MKQTMIRSMATCAAVIASAVMLFPGAATAGPAACANRVNNTHQKLLECVTLEGVREHQAALQDIADANGGTRAAGTPGYEASVDYVVERMTAAGYNVTLNEFPILFFAPAVLERVLPNPTTYETDRFIGTGSADVTASVTPVDINLFGDRSNTSGCEAADFAGFPAGSIALIQRGTCFSAVKAENAQAAGASAVIIFNQGNTAERSGLINGTLDPFIANIPVVDVSFATGEALAAPGTIAHVKVDEPQIIVQHNVLVESTGGDPNNVVMAGAHLDSVQRGPGINDNGSGSAVILEVAEQMAKVKPRNKVRFAWWGDEESGLNGSFNYVFTLPDEELDRIALYLNFDMVGSPNHVFFVLDGDDSDGVVGAPGPEGSGQIEKVFQAFYTSRGLPFKGLALDGRSDHAAFVQMGIPVGAIFTGAEGIKTAAEAALWGGTAGVQYDPCYHSACDTFDNNSDVALDANADAAAYAILQFAMNTQAINGKRGKGNFKLDHWGPRVNH
jgi:Zn-dependent M28 family amino/carboxypeptidase